MTCMVLWLLLLQVPANRVRVRVICYLSLVCDKKYVTLERGPERFFDSSFSCMFYLDWSNSRSRLAAGYAMQVDAFFYLTNPVCAGLPEYSSLGKCQLRRDTDRSDVSEGEGSSRRE